MTVDEAWIIILENIEDDCIVGSQSYWSDELKEAVEVVHNSIRREK